MPRRFRFRHPIVRRAVYESSPGGWRVGAHERVASALLAYAAQTPLASSLVPGIETAAVALAAYLGLSYVFNRPDLLATARRVRSLT